MVAYARLRIPSFVLALIAQVAGAATPDVTPEIGPIGAERFHRDALAHPPAQVGPETLARWLNERNTLLLDLRSENEFQSGHLKGALNVPLTELTEHRLEQLGIKKDTRIVVYCDFQLLPTRRIALTTLGHPTLQQLGYSHVHTLEPLWQSASCERRQSGQPCGELLPWVRAETKSAD